MDKAPAHFNLKAVFARRNAEHRARAEQVAADVLAALAAEGVKAVLTGSVARGTATRFADVDILILDSGPLSDGAAMRLVERSAKGFPVDTLWAKHLRPEVLAGMLEDTRW